MLLTNQMPSPSLGQSGDQEDRGKCLHLAFHALSDGPMDSPMIYGEVPETPHKFLSLCFYSWGSLYMDHPSLPLLSRSKCHLLCEACLDLSVETHAFSSSSRSPVSTPTPLALMSIWLFYLVSGLPDMRAQSHAPSFQKHSAAWEGLHYPCSSRAHRLCQDLARRVLTKCLLMEELHHSSMCPLFPSLPLWGHECL